MTIYDHIRPGWNKGYMIAFGLSAAFLIASPATGQTQHKHEDHTHDPYASSDYSPYSNASMRREREARRIAKEIREDAREERRSRRSYHDEDTE